MVGRSRLRGWLLDLYPDDTGLSLWLLGQDGKRHHLRQQFATKFYIAGPSSQLRLAWKWLAAQPEKPVLAREERRDLFSGMIPVLSVELSLALDLPRLFGRVSKIFPDLIYYDADIHLSLRHAARYGTYPLAECEMEVDWQKYVHEIQVFSSPWDLEILPPPLSVITMEPEVDPFHAEPRKVWIQTTQSRFALDLEPARAFLVGLQSVLRHHDPDLILTSWGDTWLLPRILQMAKETRMQVRLNRDLDQPIKHREARTYHAYGQVIHRGQQIHLAGRWHIDINNAVMYHDYSLEGIWELARLTALPVQTVARVSPGTGISSMQIVTALKDGILVPWHKQQAEDRKTILDLIRSDLGGLVFQPIIGTHKDVAEIDFVSMYPSIMANFNISPETIRPGRLDPETGLPMTTGELGSHPSYTGASHQKADRNQGRAARHVEVGCPLQAVQSPLGRPQMAAGHLLRVSRLQKCPLRKNRSPRSRDRLWTRSPPARQGSRRGVGLHHPAYVCGWSVGAKGWLEQIFRL